jgi:hypothetical protein
MKVMGDFLVNVIGRVNLEPATHECQIDYRIGIDLEDKVASPRKIRTYPPVGDIYSSINLTGS